MFHIFPGFRGLPDALEPVKTSFMIPFVKPNLACVYANTGTIKNKFEFNHRRPRLVRLLSGPSSTSRLNLLERRSHDVTDKSPHDAFEPYVQANAYSSAGIHLLTTAF